MNWGTLTQSAEESALKNDPSFWTRLAVGLPSIDEDYGYVPETESQTTDTTESLRGVLSIFGLSVATTFVGHNSPGCAKDQLAIPIHNGPIDGCGHKLTPFSTGQDIMIREHSTTQGHCPS
jgi:hypothetical protein